MQRGLSLVSYVVLRVRVEGRWGGAEVIRDQLRGEQTDSYQVSSSSSRYVSCGAMMKCMVAVVACNNGDDGKLYGRWMHRARRLLRKSRAAERLGSGGMPPSGNSSPKGWSKYEVKP